MSYKNVSATQVSEQVNPNLTEAVAAIVNGASLKLRVGYFGLCISDAEDTWLCSNDVTELARRFSPGQDPLNLIWAAAKFKDEIVFPVFL